MDSPPSNPTPATPSGHYVWEPAGENYAVHLYSEIIDRLNYEVIRGFGALPKRGAEVGGVLMGSAERGAKLIVKVEDFQSIPCEHLSGPSYVLSEKDLQELDRVLERSAKAEAGELRVVGFYRSTTRDAIQLMEQDLALLDARFPDDGAICLLIKPYNARPNEAVLLIREKGVFPTEPQTRSFVFRRKEMGVGPAPPRERSRPAAQPFPAEVAPAEVAVPADAGAAKPAPAVEVETPRAAEPEIPAAAAAEDEIAELINRGRRRQRPPLTLSAGAAREGETRTENEFASAAQAHSAVGGMLQAPAFTQGREAGAVRKMVKRNRWVWVPLSFIFLVLGVVLGFEIGLGFYRAQNLALTGDPYTIDLSVSRFGESYHLKWNPAAVAVRTAKRGELMVEEGATTKPMNLTTDDLARGGLIYRGGDQASRFRLTLFLRDRSSFSESVETPPPAH
jgi:hypothetical protein